MSRPCLSAALGSESESSESDDDVEAAECREDVLRAGDVERLEVVEELLRVEVALDVALEVSDRFREERSVVRTRARGRPGSMRGV